MSASRVIVWSAVCVACVAAAFFGGYYLRPEEAPSGPVRISFIAAAPDDFYQEVMAGARSAAEQLGVELNCIVPANINEQSAVISVLDTETTDGVAISPRSPRNQTRMLSRLAVSIPVITYDNDAPESLRHCYIGTDNYAGGKMSAELVKELIPDGGKVAIFIGDVERNNARLRRLGFVDELLDRPRSEDVVVDPVQTPMEGEKYTIVGTYLDDHNEERCRENVSQVLTEHEDIDVLVGLYGYVAPICAEVVDEQGREGKVKIVAFDAHSGTLDGIEKGKIAGTIVQNPYRYGYESIQMLANWGKDKFETPTSGSSGPVLIPCRRVDAETLDEYRLQLKQRLASGMDADRADSSAMTSPESVPE